MERVKLDPNKARTDLTSIDGWTGSLHLCVD